MPARTKRRAKFNFRGRQFVWWVDGDRLLRISSLDKRFVVALHLLGAPGKAAVLEVIGTEFPGAEAGRKRPFTIEVSDVFRPSMGATVDAVLSCAFLSTVPAQGDRS
jgi:hypothetical protein